MPKTMFCFNKNSAKNESQTIVNKAKWGELSHGACCHSKFFPTLTNCLETIFVVVTSFPTIFILGFCLKKNHAASVLN